MLTCTHSIFHATPARRVALARERFFEQGQRPTGLTSEAVIQSWGRCLGRHRDAGESIAFEPVTHSRVHLALQRNRDLVSAWGLELPRLQAVLRATRCSAVLTDATGMVIAATPFERSHERLMPIAHRVGVNLAEEAVGTTAPGITAKSGLAATVLAGEHYFDGVQTMSCTAAPIRNVAGQLAGVLDISSEGVPFGFDAASLASSYAGVIEHHLLAAQSAGLLVLRLGSHPLLLDTPAAGLVAVNAAGRLAWSNRAGAGMLGIVAPDEQGLAVDAEEIFGVRAAELASLSPQSPRLVQLPNGLSVWARAESSAIWGGPFAPLPFDGEGSPNSATRANAEDCTSRPITAAPDADDDIDDDAGLRDRDRSLISRVLSDCGGNVSIAAKRLHVSRGLIYRRLKA